MSIISDNILHTGTSIGSDTAFYERALSLNEHIRLYSFDGYKHTRILDNTCNKSTLITLNNEETHEETEFIKKAMIHLNRSRPIPRPRPTNLYELSLLKRDYNIIKDVNSLYLVGSFKENLDRLDRLGLNSPVAEMFVDKILKDNENINKPIFLPLYFYDQSWNQWFHLMYNKNVFKFIESYNIPKTYGHYAGLGPTEITDKAKNAIANL